MSLPPFNPSTTGTRRQIVELLRRAPMSAAELASALGITHNAIRGHLADLMRTGVVTHSENRKSRTRPTAVFSLDAKAEASLSKAYLPFLTHLLQSLEDNLPQDQVDQVMQHAGRRFAAAIPRTNGTLQERTRAAASVLTDLGALVDVEETSEEMIIRGHGCLLAQSIHGKPGVCRALEAMLSSYLDHDVRECCERGDRPRCCFRIGRAA